VLRFTQANPCALERATGVHGPGHTSFLRVTAIIRQHLRSNGSRRLRAAPFAAPFKETSNISAIKQLPLPLQGCILRHHLM
jgi:hypothetical protein